MSKRKPTLDPSILPKWIWRISFLLIPHGDMYGSLEDASTRSRLHSVDASEGLQISTFNRPILLIYNRDTLRVYFLIVVG